MVNLVCNEMGGVSREKIVEYSKTVFTEWKHLESELKRQRENVFATQMKLVLSESNKSPLVMIKSDYDQPSFFLSSFNPYFPELNKLKRGVCFFNGDFLHIALGNKSLFNLEELKASMKDLTGKEYSVENKNLKIMDKIKAGEKSKDTLPDAINFTMFLPKVDVNKVVSYLSSKGVNEVDVGIQQSSEIVKNDQVVHEQKKTSVEEVSLITVLIKNKIRARSNLKN